ARHEPVRGLGDAERPGRAREHGIDQDSVALRANVEDRMTKVLDPSDGIAHGEISYAEPGTARSGEVPPAPSSSASALSWRSTSRRYRPLLATSSRWLPLSA